MPQTITEQLSREQQIAALESFAEGDPDSPASPELAELFTDHLRLAGDLFR